MKRPRVFEAQSVLVFITHQQYSAPPLSLPLCLNVRFVLSLTTAQTYNIHTHTYTHLHIHTHTHTHLRQHTNHMGTGSMRRQVLELIGKSRFENIRYCRNLLQGYYESSPTIIQSNRDKSNPLPSNTILSDVEKQPCTIWLNGFPPMSKKTPVMVSHSLVSSSYTKLSTLRCYRASCNKIDKLATIAATHDLFRRNGKFNHAHSDGVSLAMLVGFSDQSTEKRRLFSVCIAHEHNLTSTKHRHLRRLSFRCLPDT